MNTGHSFRNGIILLLCAVILVPACKKDDGPHPSAANNTIVEDLPQSQKGISVFINQYISGYYESVPNHYNITTKKYPLIISLHGGGQVGDGNKDLPLVLNDGVAKEIDKKLLAPNFKVDTENLSFIVLSPQMRATPPTDAIKSFIDYAFAHYRIDPSRVYITGLSIGGVLSSEFAGHYPSLISAVIPIAGVSFGSDKEANAAAIAANRIGFWAFHNSNDPDLPATVAQNFVELINSYNPVVQPKITIFNSSAHDSWTAALDPAYRENNLNVYEWMLQYKK